MKSGYQTALKVISIIIIILSILTLIGALASFALGGLLGAAVSSPDAGIEYSGTVDGTELTQQEAGALAAGLGVGLGIFMLIEGIITLIIGICGIRGSNDPKKIGPFYVFAVFGFVFSVISFVMMFFQAADTDVSNWVSAVISIVETGVCVWLAVKIKQQAKAA